MKREESVKILDLTTGYIGRHGTEVVVSRGINASLYSGELTCLLGPNGAGKSTLLKTLSGFLTPLSGEICIGGKPLTCYCPSDLGKIVGVVLTEKLSLNNMTAQELIGMGRSPYTGFWGRLSSHDKDMVEESISLVGIDTLRDRMVHTLSDGERQKVMIAKALAQETPIIFLDEPTAFLDYPSKVEIMQLLHRLSKKRKKTVFLSTHDLELALQIADKIWLADKSLGVRIGVPEDLALCGDLAKYFKRDGVRFDMKSGMFRIYNREERRVRLKGEGCRLDMVVKALARNSIFACHDDVECSDMVEVTDNEFIYNGRHAVTIEQLLSVVTGV